MKPYLRLHRLWREAEVEFSTEPVDEMRVVALERRYGVRLPDDFREYLLFSSPVEELWDHNHTTWWHFDRIKNVPEEYEFKVTNPIVADDAQHYLFFADYMIWCQAWAIGCGEENHGRVVLFSGGEEFVANSFSEFVDKYIHDHYSLL